MSDKVPHTLDELDKIFTGDGPLTLTGEQYSEAVRSIVGIGEKTSKPEELDERIIGHVLNAYEQHYGVVGLMKELILHGNSDVSEKAFNRIPEIENQKYMSIIYGHLCGSDVEKYSPRIESALKNAKMSPENDDLIEDTIISCVNNRRSTNKIPNIIGWHKYISTTERQIKALTNIKSSFSSHHTYDLTDPIINKYLNELRKTSSGR